MKDEPLSLAQDVQDTKEPQSTHAMTPTFFLLLDSIRIEMYRTCTTGSHDLTGRVPSTKHDASKRHVRFGFEDVSRLLTTT